MIHYDRDTYRRGQILVVAGLMAMTASLLLPAGTIQADGVWSAGELSIPVLLLSGLAAFVYGAVLHRRSGAARNGGRNKMVRPDGTPVPDHVQWRVYAAMIGFALGGLALLALLSGKPPSQPALMGIGVVALAICLWKGRTPGTE